MNNKFDELAKGMAQSVTRRGALKKFGLVLAGLGMVTLGLARKAQARACKPPGQRCHSNDECCSHVCVFSNTGSVPYNRRGYGCCAS